MKMKRPIPAIPIWLLLAGAALSAETRFVIVQPGYPGSTAEAEGFVSELGGAIAKESGLADLQGSYHNDAKEALGAIGEKKPAFGIVSLGFYLAHRKDLKLSAILESRPRDRFYLAGKAGAGLSPKSLAGEAVAGTPFQEPGFVERILFGPESGAPGASKESAADVGKWKVEATRGFSKGIRDADRGKVKAVLLNGREKRSMKDISAGKDLEVFHETEELPTALVVSFGEGAEAARKAAKALEGLKGTDKGKDLLKTMGLEGFAPLDGKLLERLESRYDGFPGGGKKGEDGAKEGTPAKNS